jgi:hypothetical protein
MVFLTQPNVLWRETVTTSQRVASTQSLIHSEQNVDCIRPRGSNVVSLRDARTSLREKAHEDTSELSRKFTW